MFDRWYDKITSLYLIVTLIGLFISCILYSYFVIPIDYAAVFVMSMGGLGLVLYGIYSLVNKKVKVWNLFVIAIAFFGMISYHYAFNKRVALYGYINHREGLLVILSYYIIFLVSTTLKSKSIKDLILKVITVFGIVNVFYGLLQVFNVQYLFNIPIARNYNFASGLLINADFMGSYMVMMFSYYLGMVFLKKDKIYGTIIILEIFILGVLL